MILLLSNKWDVSVDFVVAELRKRCHPFLRINAEDLRLETATVSLPELRIVMSHRGSAVDLARDVRVIWNRRPGKPFDDVAVEERPSAAVQRFVVDQWYSWLEALQLIPGATWINHPHANDAMESKIRQLHLASSLGFRIPETVVTNDPAAVRGELQKQRKLVAKALYSPLVEESHQDYFIFSNEVEEIRLEDEDAVRLSPTIFQRALLPKVDYRVTVIADRVLSVRIVPVNPSSAALDWRTRKDGLDFVACNLPAEVEELCRKFVREAGLLFGAIDLVEHAGDFFFLEINPNGEWGWLQKPHGIPVAQALCDLTVRSDPLC